MNDLVVCPDCKAEAPPVWFCETCGCTHEPPGSLVVSSKTVAEIKESRAVALKYASDSDYEIQWMNNRQGFAEACDWFLSLLGVKEEGQ